MRILHTSDWHLGRSLYGRKRYPEFQAFLDWLIATTDEQKIDCLLVAGDIFDTSTPSNRAQELYYKFLGRIAASSCRHIVIIAGNHDSPSFLAAPQKLLQSLNIYVLASGADPAAEVLSLKDKNKQVEAIICAVPYLRDRDVRTAAPGESIETKSAKLIAGIAEHYTAVCKIAEKKQLELRQKNIEVPIIAMGHLFTEGGRVMADEGVRELYVGSLGYFNHQRFPSTIDYLALGHLHVAQKVGGREDFRYSGAPIPMGYGEASQLKKVLIVEFTAELRVTELPIPCFQKLDRLTGNLAELLLDIQKLKAANSNAWLEIEYIGPQDPELRQKLEAAIASSQLEISNIKNKLAAEQIIERMNKAETLDDLSIYDVFARYLEHSPIPENNHATMKYLYGELVKSIDEEDENKD